MLSWFLYPTSSSYDMRVILYRNDSLISLHISFIFLKDKKEKWWVTVYTWKYIHSCKGTVIILNYSKVLHNYEKVA